MNLLRKALIVERPVGEPKKVYKQLSTKAAKELKARRRLRRSGRAARRSRPSCAGGQGGQDQGRS